MRRRKNMKKSIVLLSILFCTLILASEPVSHPTGPPQPPVVSDTLYVAHLGWGPTCADPIQTTAKYSQELLFNCYDTLITMGNPVTNQFKQDWAVNEQYWAFQPSLATNVPDRSETFLTVPDDGIDPNNPVGYWFQPVPPDGKYYRIEAWDCNYLNQKQGSSVRTEEVSSPEEPFVPGEIIVGFENVSAGTLEGLREAGGHIIDEISQLQAVVVCVPTGTETEFIKAVNSIQGFRYAEPNGIVYGTYTPNDPEWNQQWNMRIIEADKAWDINKGDPTLIIAIVDSGVDYTHPDLAARYVSGGLDWANNDEDPMDDLGHGTHCAGIASAVINNGVGVAGVAQVGILAEKVLGADNRGSFNALANAIVHATDLGANIISMSLGWYQHESSDDPPGNWTGTSSLVASACAYAWNHGVLLVASAGNDNTCIDTNPHYPSGYDIVIAVSATTSSDKIWIWGPNCGSNWGSDIELAAPGEYIYSTTPGNSYDMKTGTSMACPHVAGVAALAWSQFPSLTNQQLRKHLQRSVDDLGAPGKDARYGYGRINALKAMSITQGLSSGDVLYIGEYAEMGNLASIITVRTWHLTEYVPHQVLRLQRWYYDFNMRPDDGHGNPIYYVNALGTIVDTFDIYDAEYSFKRGLTQDPVPMGKFCELLFNQMDTSYWDTGNPANVYLLAYLIKDAIEIISVEPPILRMNVGTLFSDISFKQILCGTWSSIMSKEWCVDNGCWNGDLLTDGNGDGYPDWWPQWHWRLSPIQAVDPTHYVGTGPYRVTIAEKLANIVVLERNTLHWNGWPAPQRKAFVDRVNIDFIASQITRTNAFNNCQVDICDNPNATALLYDPRYPFIPWSKYPEIKIIMLDSNPSSLLRKWLKYWVKGWYYNAYYPSDYYYHLYKEQTCWCDITGPTPGTPDGRCNMRDISWPVELFGARAPPASEAPSYDPKWAPGTYGYGGCDVWGDRRIDMRDIGLACNEFMHTTQP